MDFEKLPYFLDILKISVITANLLSDDPDFGMQISSVITHSMTSIVLGNFVFLNLDDNLGQRKKSIFPSYFKKFHPYSKFISCFSPNLVCKFAFLMVT